MRVQKNTLRKDNVSNTPLGKLSRQSMQKDFSQYGRKPEKKSEVDNPVQEGAEKRVSAISDKCEYSKFARLIVGNTVRLVRRSIFTNSWVCEFVFEEDRLKLNKAGGWSNSKKEYIFEGLKFK